MSNSFIFRPARRDDLASIVALLADDPLGQEREAPNAPLAQEYIDAFDAIDRDPNQYLAVVLAGEEIVGTLQLTFIPGISRKGSWRGQIEAVRIARAYRNAQLGQHMMEWAIRECRRRGCRLVQLTSDKGRQAAHRFYERLGFQASHDGFKLSID